VTETSVTVDPKLAAGLLDDALAADAAAGPAADAPPVVPWLNEDGTPKWGTKKDGTPRRAKPGPGAPKRNPAEQQPRTTDQASSTPGQDPGNLQPAPAAHDYTGAFRDAGLTIWMGLSAIPFTTGHAFLLHSQIPALATGLNAGAQKNPWLARQAAKLEAGEGYLWVIPLTVPLASLAMGSWQLIRDQDLRRELGGRNDQLFQAFVTEQAKAAGLNLDDPQGAQEPQEDPNASPGPTVPEPTP
jgi:hypothetical protein